MKFNRIHIQYQLGYQRNDVVLAPVVRVSWMWSSVAPAVLVMIQREWQREVWVRSSAVGPVGGEF